ncbi:aminopeptidase P family protein [Gymnodinialimonas ceratoperidinii]|uniref:Aminopeptidase P family protein n=1 Tax=Gymnodinialimonas ceratoperidinii TaxID=2856823 RepID=A0A8F6YE68_9RHOB|nr:aminopeptidase P family protein [Gymnodinialimonas ceratoperidinii]QXT41275.1 aminopeptidase P family protein [Gymnodinialimonas ceratoperidinii]
MFQDFTAATKPEDGPPRLDALRAHLAEAGLDGFIVPRADAHQGEYVTAADARLAWLTGFTGSAGFAVVLPDVAGVFIDGRYRVQVKAQVADVFTPVPWPEKMLEDWLIEALPSGGTVGFDPWLHTVAEIERVEAAVSAHGITLEPVANAVDAIWTDRPARPDAPVQPYPESLAGTSSAEKRRQIAETLTQAGEAAAVLTLPDSINWLLNIRGGDLAHLPVVQAFAIIDAKGTTRVFSDPEKFDGLTLDAGVTLAPWSAFKPALAALTGPVRVDPNSAPAAVKAALDGAGIEMARGSDPCLLPKARKTAAELAGSTRAHLRDAVALTRFLHWFDETAPSGGLTEIDVARQLEAFRAETGALRDISFDTIAGAGSNGAIVHYRVTEQTNAPVKPGQLFLIDSGGQYEDGTTDITRTLPVGEVGAEERECFTLVLQGMIAIHRTRFPKGVAGMHLDALARAPLWATGRDYDHGTGHGVGVYLSVHEGPQGLSRRSKVPLEPGMIVSNEPGYYREGAFGIRIENLIHVVEATGGADPHREMLGFETLTYVPIDRRLIVTEMLSPAERAWLNAYHAEVLARVAPLLQADGYTATAAWLEAACAPI